MTNCEGPASTAADAARCPECAGALDYRLEANEGGGLRYLVSCTACAATFFDFAAPALRNAGSSRTSFAPKARRVRPGRLVPVGRTSPRHEQSADQRLTHAVV